MYNNIKRILIGYANEHILNAIFFNCCFTMILILYLAFSMLFRLSIIQDSLEWWKTRSSADADNALDAFVGQSRSTNILGPFQVK